MCDASVKINNVQVTYNGVDLWQKMKPRTFNHRPNCDIFVQTMGTDKIDFKLWFWASQQPINQPSPTTIQQHRPPRSSHSTWIFYHRTSGHFYVANVITLQVTIFIRMPNFSGEVKCPWIKLIEYTQYFCRDPAHSVQQLPGIGKHWFRNFLNFQKPANMTKLHCDLHFLTNLHLLQDHITSPQIILLVILLMSSKPVASNNSTQCFGVFCQGLEHF